MQITNKKASSIWRGILAAVPVLAAVGLVVTQPLAGAVAAGDTVNYTPVPFVLSQWTTDRTAPSGGLTVGDFAGRTGVLAMGIDGAKQTTNTWYRYEGVQRSITGSTAVKASLYVDSAWPSQVNAGMWGVGADSTGAVSAYPIIAYVKGASYTGWRTFNDNTGGWVNLPRAPHHNGWNTVAITYNTATTAFDFTVDGVNVGSSYATGSVGLSAVILDNYNFGANYTVHWSDLATGVLVTAPTSKAQCKDNGWQALGFRNQGACVSYANHHNGVSHDDAVVADKR